MAQQEGISVGPDQEIKLIAFNYDDSMVFEVDEFYGGYSNEVLLKYAAAPDPLWQLWNKIETECVVECCGIQAFGLWPDDIDRAVGELDREGLLEQLNELKQKLKSSKEEIVGYHRLNQNFAKSSFLQILDHLISCSSSSNVNH